MLQYWQVAPNCGPCVPVVASMCPLWAGDLNNKGSIGRSQLLSQNVGCSISMFSSPDCTLSASGWSWLGWLRWSQCLMLPPSRPLLKSMLIRRALADLWSCTLQPSTCCVFDCCNHSLASPAKFTWTQTAIACRPWECSTDTTRRCCLTKGQWHFTSWCEVASECEVPDKSAESLMRRSCLPLKCACTLCLMMVFRLHGTLASSSVGAGNSRDVNDATSAGPGRLCL